MTQTFGVRATSFVASSALLGMAVIAAFTMTLVQQPISDFPDSIDPFDVIREPPPIVEPPPRIDEAPPLRPIAEFSFDQFVADLQSLPQLTLLPATVGNAASPPLVADPEWVRVPRDLGRYYPARALERGVEGSVTLNCLVDTNGALECAVESETPENWGFAPAALRISRDYQMVPATRDGVAIAARHRMVIPFRLQ